jgi:RsiW-degrading membrane proteinase PrsW (M82 family)
MQQTLQNPSIECIDGKDDHLLLPFEQHQQMILGHHPSKSFVSLKGLNQDDGFIVFTFDSSGLQMDASNCSTTVKLNGYAVSKAQALTSNDIIKIGSDVWRINFSDATANATNSLFKSADKDSFTGLEDLNSLDLKVILGDVFKKKSYQDMEDQLLSGTSRNQPQITDLEISWARPWLYARFMLFSVLLGIAFYFTFTSFQNPNVLPGLIFISTFAIPLSVLLFYMEMNTPRNVSIFNIMLGLFAGGFVSIFISLVLFMKMDYLSFLGASSAGIIEEIGKLLAVIIIFSRFRSFKWIQNGLLFGATIGCGFGAFESAGYVLNYFLKYPESLSDMILLRGINAPFMHVVWTANAAAALWMVKGDKPFAMSMLLNKNFLRIFITSILLHMTWNAPFEVYPIFRLFDVKQLLLGYIGWAISFKLIQAGLKQVIEERKKVVEQLAQE